MRPVIIGGVPRIWDYATSDTESLFAKMGNTGNLAFQYAIQKHVGRNSPIVGWSSDPNLVQTKGDIAVIPCANQLGPRTDQIKWAAFVEELHVRVLALGLGAQAASHNELPDVPEGTKRWVRAIAERGAPGVPNIGVRGEFTRRVLERMGYKEEICVLGCPSLFINGNPRLGQVIAERLERTPRRIAVAAGKPSNAALADLEKRLLGIARDSGGLYIVQHPLPFVKVARGEERDIDEPWKKRIQRFLGIPSDISRSRSWAPRNMKVFFEVNAWMEELRMHDFVVGTRIHGVALAIQAGVPALCITHDSRTKELCDTMGIPNCAAGELDVEDLDVNELRRHINFDPDEFDANRIRIGKRYADFLSANGIVSEPLVRLCDVNKVDIS